MTSREQTLAIVLLGAVALTVGGAGGYMFIWQPLKQQEAAEEKLTKEIEDLEAQLKVQGQKAKQLDAARVRSLPADEELARRVYPQALAQLAEAAGVPKGYTVTPKADNSARNIPEISKGKPVYTRFVYEVTFKKADMWAVKDFLEGYYRLGLLHQITALHIKKDEDPTGKNAGKRNDLTVTLTTEAILVDGAENRRTLVPIPTAFAAVGGAAIFKGMSSYKGHDAKGLEFGHGITPVVTVPILSSSPRDYSLIVRKDPFNGPLPVVPPVPFKVAKISDVKIRPNEPPAPVKVSLSGEGSTGATVVALAEGDLFAEGALKVDPKTHAIELPETSAYEGTSTVTVIATAADGKVIEKASFKVTVAEPKIAADKGEDISPFVVLIGVTRSDDGKVWARILDNANRMRYQINADRSGIKVAKEEIFIPRRGWQATADSKGLPAGVMIISAPGSETHRTFKVIAVDTEGLIVADVHPGGKTPPPGGKGPRPPAGKQPANPMAALGGNMIVTAPAPKYYRWAVGQSLAGIKLLTSDEAKKVLKQAEAAGPVVDVAAVER